MAFPQDLEEWMFTSSIFNLFGQPQQDFQPLSTFPDNSAGLISHYSTDTMDGRAQNIPITTGAEMNSTVLAVDPEHLSVPATMSTNPHISIPAISGISPTSSPVISGYLQTPAFATSGYAHNPMPATSGYPHSSAIATSENFGMDPSFSMAGAYQGQTSHQTVPQGWPNLPATSQSVHSALLPTHPPFQPHQHTQQQQPRRLHSDLPHGQSIAQPYYRNPQQAERAIYGLPHGSSPALNTTHVSPRDIVRSQQHNDQFSASRITGDNTGIPPLSTISPPHNTLTSQVLAPLPSTYRQASDTQPSEAAERPQQTRQIYSEIRRASKNPQFRTLHGESRVYFAWSGKIETLEEAEKHLLRKRWTPYCSHVDKSIPETQEAKLAYAKQLYYAMIDFESGFVDKVQTQNKVNRLVQRTYQQEEIEARCIQAVHKACVLHKDGSELLASSDNTYEAIVKAKEVKARGRGADNYKPSHRSEADRNMTFVERWTALCEACMTTKAVATDILDGDKMEDAIYCPRQHMAIKITNMHNNDSKMVTSLAAKRKRSTDAVDQSPLSPAGSPANRSSKRTRTE